MHVFDQTLALSHSLEVLWRGDEVVGRSRSRRVLLRFFCLALVLLLVHLGQPLDPVEVGVVEHLGDGEPVLGVHLQHLREQVQKLLIEVLGVLVGNAVGQADSLEQSPVRLDFLNQTHFHRAHPLVFLIHLQKPFAAN